MYFDNPIYNKKNIPINLMIIVLGLLLFWIIFSQNDEPKYKFFSFALLIILFTAYSRKWIESIYILFIMIIQSKIANIIVIFLSSKPTLQFFLLLPFWVAVIVFAAILILILPIYIFTFFHQNFFLPDNLKNLKYLESSLNTKDYNQSKISYFNDKYIFIEHTKEGNATIEILKFENLFEK